MSAAVIFVVNGNLGAGIAVAGAFSLVRFRSAQGSAHEILSVFLSMSLGLCAGAGYVGIAALLLLLYIAVMLLLSALHFGEEGDAERLIKITVPEVLDYENLFDDVLNQHTKHWTLESVRTAEMGSVYRLEYRVTSPRPASAAASWTHSAHETETSRSSAAASRNAGTSSDPMAHTAHRFAPPPRESAGELSFLRTILFLVLLCYNHHRSKTARNDTQEWNGRSRSCRKATGGVIL